MTTSTPPLHDSARLDLALGIIFGLVSTCAALYTLWYFASTWREVHSQGIGHLYLAVMTVLSFWYFSFAGVLCLAGSLWSAKKAGRSVLARVGGGGAGAFLGLSAPPMMIAGWYMAILWIHGHL